MSLGDLIEQMMEAGAPMPAVLLAVRAIEARDAETAARRARAAEKKRNERSSKRLSRDCPATVPRRGEDTPPIEVSSSPLSSETKVSSEGETPRARKDRVFACPPGVDPQHWADFLANRKTKRLTNTPTAYRQQLKALRDLTDDEWPPGRIVEFAAASGWAAIHDPRTSYRNPQNGQHRTPAAERPSNWLAARDQVRLPSQ